jgi:hypothetical protein
VEKAFDPWKNELLTPARYELLYDKPVGKLARQNARPDARCPVCLGKVHVKGGSIQTTYVFAHRPSDDFCPIKKLGAKKYSVLAPVQYDVNVAKKLRENFFLNWRLHWLQFLRYVNYVDVQNFIDVLKHADKDNIWGYQGLQEYEVTYILLVLMHFPPVKKFPGKPKNIEMWREEWASFWFPATVREIGDFWNLQPARRCVVKLLYTTSAKMALPNAHDRSYIEVVAINETYLVGKDPAKAKVENYVINKMTKAFRRDLGAAPS